MLVWDVADGNEGNGTVTRRLRQWARSKQICCIAPLGWGLGGQVLEQGAGQRRLQFLKAEHQARAPVHQQGGTAAGHEAGEQAQGDDPLLARGYGPV